MIRLSEKVFLLLCLGAATILGTTGFAQAQPSEGNQFLDGIGETALVARYVLAGNTEDWSRNNRHATVLGGAETYVDDARFGRVLSLDGAGGGYLALPGDALMELDTISVAGWVFYRSEAAWQRFFDFGQGTTANFFCTPLGGQSDGGCRARITTTGWNGERGPTSPRLALHRWVHLAVVLDADNETLTIYADGKQVGRAENIQWTLEDVLSQEDKSKNHLFVGKSQYAADGTANVMLHDIRIYSTALTETQVGAIHGNALSNDETAVSNMPAPSESERSGNEDLTSPMIYGSPLVVVADVDVETFVGRLPRLPLLVPAKFKDGDGGSDVRVIWPAPRDNAQVLEATTYTIVGSVPGTDLRPKAVVRVVTLPDRSSEAPVRLLEPFSLGEVTLNRDEQGRVTPLMRNRDKFVHALAATNPDSFLFMFRDAFGQQQPEGARPLGGWDSQATRLRGHASGHYLSAIAQAYASCTGDESLRAAFKQKMDYMVETLHDLAEKSGRPREEGGECTADPAAVPPGPGRNRYTSDLSREGIRTDYWHWGQGFISAYPPDQFIMLEQGATYGGGNDQIWAPYYTLHKILAGLLDCYEIGGNEQGLEVARGMGLWGYERLRRVPAPIRIGMWNRYIAGEFGGMNEVLARLYRLTEDTRFLECAQLFDNVDFFFGNADRAHGLACNVDTIRGKHANQHIPQITGALEIYRCNHELRYYDIADNFWHLCTGSYMYAIGGVAGAGRPDNAECFTAEPDSLFRNGFSKAGQNETCATYNLLKLSRQLFMYGPHAEYMDYYERGFYNHILASVAEDDAGNTYHVPLNAGARKQFGNAEMDSFTCCNGTALESNTKLQDSIYFQSADHRQLYVNLFVPSTLNWRARGLMITQATSFPYSDRTQLTIGGSGQFTLMVRVPDWATQGVHVSLNGTSLPIEATPGEYLTLDRTWTSGDTVELRLPMSFRLSRVMDQPNIASIFYGPVLLAVEESRPLSEWRKVQLDPRDVGRSIEGDTSSLHFRLEGLQLKPFFEMYGRYSVYLDVTTQ